LRQTFTNFGEEEADLKRWINEALAQAPSGLTFQVRKLADQKILPPRLFLYELAPNLPSSRFFTQQHLSNLRSEVQQQATTWSNAMEEKGAACLPRVVRSLKEIESLRAESEELGELISQFQMQVNHLEMDTAQSIKVLSELDNIKKRMDSCSAVFQQADRFKSLLRNMDVVYASGDVVRMSSALSEMVSSFSSLSSLAEFEGDKALVSRYTEKLEAIVKPKLLKAFEEHDSQQAAACISTFQQINRADQTTLAYHKHINQKLISMWQSYDPPSTQPSATTARPSTPSAVQPESPSAITTWIRDFFESHLAYLRRELAWIPAIFNEAPTAIAKVLISSYTQLSALLDLHLKKLDLPALVNVYTATRNYATQLDPLVVPLGAGLRFQSFQALFAPFRPYQLQFSFLESKLLATKISRSQNQQGEALGRRDPAEISHGISKQADATFTALHGSIDRCIQFTEGFEAEALEKLLEVQVVGFLNWASQQLQTLQPMLTHAAPSSLTATTDWREDLFTLAVETLRVAIKIKNSQISLTTAFRSKLGAQRASLFGEQSLKDIHTNDIPVTPNLFLYNTDSIKHLAKLFDGLDDPQHEFFATCLRMEDALISTVQFIMFESMFGFIKQQMAGFGTLANFAKETNQPSPAPQSYIKQIVEHFLILPQVMETMEGETEETSADQITIQTLPVDPFSLLGRPKYFGVTASAYVATSDEESTGFSGDWMAVVAKETQLLLASHVLQLPRLTNFGVLQLEADILHLFNVLSVLGLRQEKLLETLLEFCRVPAQDFPRLLSETIDAEQKKVLILIGRSRKVLPSASKPETSR
jgi:hypothetical protein